MGRLRAEQKCEVKARIASINYSGIEGRMSSDITRHSQSFLGRDFKVWAQMAPFILPAYLSPDELQLWLSLSEVCTCNFHFIR